MTAVQAALLLRFLILPAQAGPASVRPGTESPGGLATSLSMAPWEEGMRRQEPRGQDLLESSSALSRSRDFMERMSLDAPLASAAAPAGIFDFSRFEIEALAGLALFSEDAESDPKPCAGLLFRAPLPWLSPRSNPLGDYFGFFAEFIASSIERDITPPVGPEDSGPLYFAGAGVDFALVRSPNARVRIQAGGQYQFYGDVSGLDDGWASVVGLQGAVRVWGGLWLTANPQLAFGNAGDKIGFAQAGLLYAF